MDVLSIDITARYCRGRNRSSNMREDSDTGGARFRWSRRPFRVMSVVEKLDLPRMRLALSDQNFASIDRTVDFNNATASHTLTGVILSLLRIPQTIANISDGWNRRSLDEYVTHHWPGMRIYQVAPHTVALWYSKLLLLASRLHWKMTKHALCNHINLLSLYVHNGESSTVMYANDPKYLFKRRIVPHREICVAVVAFPYDNPTANASTARALTQHGR